MNVDVIFSNARVYNIDRFDVLKGETFSLLTDRDEVSVWFSNNDPVLNITVKDDGKSAEIKATETGDSMILIMDSLFFVVKKISILVVDSIDQAANLNVTGGEPLPK